MIFDDLAAQNLSLSQSFGVAWRKGSSFRHFGKIARAAGGVALA